ncbi:MAG TPA: TadE family protein [candidate division Zixibacteria bacterium]|nr:TadE family protein [candidate division Zixibacteria bacterium]
MLGLMNRRRGGRRGQTLVEFALILPIFVLLLMGILDLGRAVYYSSTLSNAAREAARRAIVDQTCSHVSDFAVQRAVGMQNVTTTVWWTSPTGATTRSCSPESGAASIGDITHVTVEYDFNAATPIIGNLVGTIHLQGESAFPVEATCIQDTPAGTVCPPGS